VVGTKAFQAYREPGVWPGQATPGEEHEALSYPVAFWGFLLSSAFIIGWGVVAGIRPDVTLAIWLLGLVTLIGLTRLVVEGGILLMTPNWMPLGVLGQIFNAGPGTWLSPANGIVQANFMSSALIADPRAFSMPSFMQGFKLAYDHRIPGRKLLALIFACIFITFAMSCWMRIKLGYEQGGLTLGSWFFVKVGSQFPRLVHQRPLQRSEFGKLDARPVDADGRAVHLRADAGP
jgi:hypothetical protein